jgi:Xaa-Pro aminopeptidase
MLGSPGAQAKGPLSGTIEYVGPLGIWGRHDWERFALVSPQAELLAYIAGRQAGPAIPQTLPLGCDQVLYLGIGSADVQELLLAHQTGRVVTATLEANPSFGAVQIGRSVVAELPRRGDRLVIIGAHYDSFWNTAGAYDNASGAACLLSLAHQLRDGVPGLNVRLVWFGSEEWLLAGSNAYVQMLEERGLDYVVIYADREHAANFAYLTGFGPRFEEALLIVGQSGAPRVLLGTENLNMVDFTPVRLEAVHFPSFGLLGQPRGGRSLVQILQDAGLKPGMTVGTVGWKYFEAEDGCPAGSIEVPHYIAAAVAEAVGHELPAFSAITQDGPVRNVTDIFMSPAYGLRTELEAEQIIVHEYAACVVSKAILDLLNTVEVGVSELELGSKLASYGLPLSAHAMVSVGDKARFGLTSPTDRRAKLGDFLTTAFGLEGALCCRAAFIAHDAGELPGVDDWFERVAVPYFKTAVEWYEMVRIGLEGGAIFQLAMDRLPKSFYGWELNPGHLIAQDEWVSTPFMPGSKVKLRSGMYMQFDLIIAPKPPYFGANLEDGIVLADQGLRERIRALSPQTWSRFERRRKYIKEVLGINLAEEILPMSDLLAYYRPFLLQKDQIMVAR